MLYTCQEQLSLSQLNKCLRMLQGRSKITKHVEREVICHSNFCHPHVIQFKEIFLTPTHLAIAMEYAPGGDMFHFVKKNSGLKVCKHALETLCLLSAGHL